MPGTPINRADGDSDKAEVDKSRNGQDRPDEYQQENQPAVRELTQTDRLNKRLLETVLERMSSSDAYDKFLDKKRDENDVDEDLDERNDHMSLSENEAQNSDENERKSNDENVENDDNEETGRKVVPKGTVKRIVRNPVPKLNAQRLIGPKGVQTIENYFEGFKFYGKGHEKKDLDRIMKRLEHWAHRLFPKYQFDDFLEKAEAVGPKKELQTFLKKYRRDMDLGDGGTAANDDDDNVERGNSPEPMDEFDMLIAEQIEKSKQATNARAQAAQRHNDEIFNNLLNPSSQPLSQIISSSQAAIPENTNNQTTTSITASSSKEINKINVEESEEEVKKRIERNRQMAIERRLARLKRDEENKRKKETKSQEVNVVEPSQITSDELLQTQSQSTNGRNEIRVTVTIEKNVDSMHVNNFNTQSVEDKQEIDKNIGNENADSMIVDISKEYTDNIPTAQSKIVQNTSSIDENNVDNPKDLINHSNQAVIVEKIHDKNKNNPKLLTDEELDKEIDDAVNQFIIQKRQLQ